MPAAVIMEENYDKLLEQCETQELEVSFTSPRLDTFSENRCLNGVYRSKVDSMATIQPANASLVGG